MRLNSQGAVLLFSELERLGGIRGGFIPLKRTRHNRRELVKQLKGLLMHYLYNEPLDELGRAAFAIDPSLQNAGFHQIASFLMNKFKTLAEVAVADQASFISLLNYAHV